MSRCIRIAFHSILVNPIIRDKSKDHMTAIGFLNLESCKFLVEHVLLETGQGP
jgi:hypothetical protein